MKRPKDGHQAAKGEFSGFRRLSADADCCVSFWQERLKTEGLAGFRTDDQIDP